MTRRIEIRGKNIGEDGCRFIVWRRFVWWKYIDVLEEPAASIIRLDCNVGTLVSDLRTPQNAAIIR
jgi:hypothetical protein